MKAQLLQLVSQVPIHKLSGRYSKKEIGRIKRWREEEFRDDRGVEETINAVVWHFRTCPYDCPIHPGTNERVAKFISYCNENKAIFSLPADEREKKIAAIIRGGFHE